MLPAATGVACIRGTCVPVPAAEAYVVPTWGRDSCCGVGWEFIKFASHGELEASVVTGAMIAASSADVAVPAAVAATAAAAAAAAVAAEVDDVAGGDADGGVAGVCSCCCL